VKIGGTAIVRGLANISGKVFIRGDTVIEDDAVITESKDIINISPFILKHDSLTVFRCRSDSIKVLLCRHDSHMENEFSGALNDLSKYIENIRKGNVFNGTLDEFEKYIEELNYAPNYIEKYRAAINFIKITIDG
ncbi:MAG: hypothetical protein M3Z87_08885, partial [Lactobacillus sp.]|nr:hypothetical protein [Lactobacillus sp.]